MQKNVFLILILIFSCKSYLDSKPNDGLSNRGYISYFNKINEADSLYLVKEYKKSYALLDSVFSVYEPLNIEGLYEYYTYVASAFASGNFINGRNYVKNSFLKYGAIKSHFTTDSILNLALLSSKYTDKEIDDFINRYNSKLNLKLRNEVEEMIKTDQFVRKDRADFDSNKLDSVNEINTKKIRKIFDNVGYPSYKLIGYSSFNERDINLSAVFLHTDIAFKKEYLLPKLLEFVKNGDCEPYIYSTVYDRTLLDESNFSGRQLYGQIKGGGMKLINKNKIDSIRHTIGLPSLNYDRWRLIKQFNGENPYINN
jgi:hypothetical protein